MTKPIRNREIPTNLEEFSYFLDAHDDDHDDAHDHGDSPTFSTDYNVITSRFGMRDNPVTGKTQMHHGVDKRAREGTPIKAFKGGTVTKVVRDYTEGTGPGKHVFIKDPKTNEIHSYYHLSKINDDLKVGDSVSSGDQFGLAGSTGGSAGAHLHFEIHQQNKDGVYKPVDPIKAYPEFFKQYTEKATGKPVTINQSAGTDINQSAETGNPLEIDKILKSSTRIKKPGSI